MPPSIPPQALQEAVRAAVQDGVVNMNNEKNEDWSTEAWSVEEDMNLLPTDDQGTSMEGLLARIPQLLDSVTRIGGEVCRLRAEVDGLLEQNAELLLKFSRMVAIIEEKGVLNMEDFELACEVLGGEEGTDGRWAARRPRH